MTLDQTALLLSYSGISTCFNLALALKRALSTVLRVIPISELEQKWVFPQEEFSNAELSMIDADGNYIMTVSLEGSEEALMTKEFVVKSFEWQNN